MTEWLAERFVPGFSLLEPRSPADLRTFRAHGHNAARVLGGKFIDDPQPGVCMSHKRARIVFPDVTVRALLHNQLPLLAFAANEPESCLYEYIDAPALARAFGEVFLPVPMSALKAPVDLLALERAVGRDPDLQYWTPRCLGEILYNFWD